METNPFRARRLSASEDGSGGRPGPEAEPGAPAGAPERARRWVEACVRGRTWWYRLPVLLFMAWILRGYLTQPGYASIFSGITLGFHEMGHAFFMWFGDPILTAAGGTLFQVAIPLAAAGYLLWKQRDPFGATVGTFWLGSSLVDAGRYAADARAQALPLVSPFGPVDPSSHDWTTVLLKFGMLSRDQAIGGALHDAGIVAMAASLAGGVWVLRVMARSGGDGAGPRPAPGEEARLRAFLEGEEGREEPDG